MPTLPDISSLSQVTAQPDRAVASYNSGQTSEAMQGVGNVIANAAEGYQEKQDALQTAYAKSNLISGLVNAKNSFNEDPDYTTYQQRYLEKANGVVQQSASMITNPRQRQMFEAQAGEHMKYGLNDVQMMASRQEKNYGQMQLAKALDQQTNTYQAAPDEMSRTTIINSVSDMINATVGKGYIEPLQGYTLQRKWAEGAGKANLMRLSPEDQNNILRPTIPGEPSSSDNPNVVSAITKAATDNGVNPDTLMRIAKLESGANPNATNPSSSASGLFQFTGDTAKQYGLSNPLDANESANAAARLMVHNNDILQSDLGRTPSPDELYLAHQQGAAGASALLQNPKKNAVSVLTDAGVSPNQAEQSIVNNGGTTDMTAGEFASHWKDKFNAAGGDQNSATKQIVNFIPPGERIGIYNRNQAAMRKDLEGHINDAIAMAQDGKTDPQPLQKQQFINAYGADGINQYQDYLSSQQWASDLNTVSTQTPEQQAATLATHEPVEGGGYEVDSKRYQALQNAIVKVNQDRQKDPMAWALQNDVGNAQPLDFTDTGKLADGLADRVSTASALSKTYGVPNMPLTANESNLFAAQLDNQNTGGKVNLLQTMVDGIKDPQSLSNVLRQISPAHPVEALAASYLGMQGNLDTATTHLFSADTHTYTNPSDVAMMMVKGNSLLNPTKADKQEEGKFKQFVFPPDGDNPNSATPSLQKDFNGIIGSGFAGNPEFQAQVYQGTRAVYAVMAADAGVNQGVYDPNIGQKAVNMVVGNVATMKKGNVVPPYGMTASDFLDSAKSAYTAQVLPIPGAPKFEDSNLVYTNTPGIYKVRSGTNYLNDAQGAPVILDVNNTNAGNHIKTATANNNKGAQ